MPDSHLIGIIMWNQQPIQLYKPQYNPQNITAVTPTPRHTAQAGTVPVPHATPHIATLIGLTPKDPTHVPKQLPASGTK